jgi:hypothetical protein
LLIVKSPLLALGIAEGNASDDFAAQGIDKHQRDLSQICFFETFGLRNSLNFILGFQILPLRCKFATDPKKLLLVEAGDEGLTAAAQFYALAA